MFFSIPIKTHKALDYISVDFTTITIGSGHGILGYGGTSNYKKDPVYARGRMQKKVEGQRKNKMINVRQIEAPAGETEKSEVSINPIIENKSSDVALWGESSIQGGNAGLSGYGSGEKGTGSGYGSLESGGAGKDGFGAGYGHGYGHGAGHGGINIADYAYLRDIIMKNITYPEKARRMGWEGRVILSFVVSETGLVNEVKILKSSGYHVLDEAAKEALFKINGFKKKHERLVVQLPIEFRLR